MKLSISCSLTREQYRRKILIESAQGTECFHASRALTGTADEGSRGIFEGIGLLVSQGPGSHLEQETETFVAFGQKKEFVFDPLPENANAQQVLDCLLDRAALVKDWVATLSGFETSVVLVEGEIQ